MPPTAGDDQVNVTEFIPGSARRSRTSSAHATTADGENDAVGVIADDDGVMDMPAASEGDGVRLADTDTDTDRDGGAVAVSCVAASEPDDADADSSGPDGEADGEAGSTAASTTVGEADADGVEASEFNPARASRLDEESVGSFGAMAGAVATGAGSAGSALADTSPTAAAEEVSVDGDAITSSDDGTHCAGRASMRSTDGSGVIAMALGCASARAGSAPTPSEATSARDADSATVRPVARPIARTIPPTRRPP